MLRLAIDPDSPVSDALQPAVEALTRSAIVAFPTDTLYGLAVDPRSFKAVAALYALKDRGATEAVPLVASDERQVAEQVGRISPLAARLARHFWPGPLTLVIEASPRIVPLVHGSSSKIGVRVPGHPVARQLAALAGHPLTATSANRRGGSPAATPDQVAATLADAVDVLIDAGAAPGGPPSTIIDVTGSAPLLVRAGAVPWERVVEFLESLDV